MISKSLAKLLFLSGTILSLALPINVSAEESSVYSSSVNVTVPVTVNAVFNEDGTTDVSSLNINNSSLVPITVDSVDVYGTNGWSLVSESEKIKVDNKKINLKITYKDMLSGNNVISHNVAKQYTSSVPISIKRGAWTKSVTESAFNLSFNYNIGQSDFKLSFNSNGGSSVNAVTIKNGETTTLATPTRTGYTFAGWKSSTGVIYNGGSVYTMPIGDQTLTAQWKANTNTKYVVNHYQMNLDGSTYALKETENKTGTSDSTLTTANLKKTYNGFTYENSKVGSSVVTTTTISPDGSRVVNLYYSRNQYYLNVSGWLDGIYSAGLSNNNNIPYATVDVYINGKLVGNQINDYCYKHYYGSSYEIKNVIVQSGREFNGYKIGNFNNQNWVSNTGTITENGNQILLDLSTVNYSVTYKLNGGTNPSSGVTSSYTVDSNAFTLPTPSRTGYTFGGWYDNSSLTGTAITSVPKGSTGNKTYYAKWNLITYNITYNLNGGSATNPSTYNVGSTTFSLNNPSKTGYTFSGWTGSNGTTPSKSVSISKGSTGNKSYTANWTANKYSVVFNSNGGSGTMSNQTHTYGSSLALTSNSFTRTGYTFAGWNTKADGSGTNYTNGQSVSNLVSSSGGSITLYAKWTLNNYSITYNLNGGSNPSTGVTKSYNVTSSTITLPTPTRTGYTFGGWFTSSSLSGTAVTTIASGSTGNKVYYAKWNLVNYTISYNLAGGSLANANPSSYNVETATFSLNTPTKLGYAFAGWTGTGLSSATTSVSIAKGSTGNRSYTATWTSNKYTLTFNANGGSVSEATRTVAFGSAYGTLPTPKRTGYTFKGWFTSASGGTKVSSSTIMTSATGATIYAQWTVNNYTLTFNANGGSVSESSRSLAYGTAYGTLPTPSRTGYTFKGWFTASSGGTQVTTTTTMGASNTTVYAQWTVINYKIAYNLNGGTNASGAATSFNITSSTITLPTPTRTGYTFGGWYANSSFSGSAVTTIPTGSTGNKTYYAKWNLVTYTIRYSLDGGTISGNPTSYNVTTSTFTLPTPTKTGYTFLGWTGSNGTTASTSVSISQGSTGNKSYTANWKINSYKLTYNANGGSVSTASKSLTYGSAYGTLPTPTRSGYKFNGWYTASSGGTKVSDTTTIGASNVTIYAQWSLVTYTINYNLNGGTNPSSNPSSYNVTSSAITLANPTRTGYTFGGWYTESSFTNKVTSITTGSTGNKTFYAKWTANTYTVSYDANGGSGTTASSSHTYGTAKTLTSNGFSRTGYTFLGWSTNKSATSATYTNAQSVTNLSSTNGATVKLYAVWKANSYTYNITYVSSSGKSLGTSTVAGTFGTSTTVSAPSKTGYTTPSSQSVTFDSTTPKTIKFTYPLVSYTIGYKLNGGSASNPTSYNIESSAITLNAPTRTGYTFTGWTGSNGTTASTSVSIASGSTGNKTYTANWKANSYTIKFNSNGGSGTMSNLAMTYGTAKNLTSNSFTRTGYTFAGWATSASGNVVYSNSQSVNNLSSTNGATVTLYAKWTPVNYSITYNLNGGSISGQKTSYTIETSTFSLPTPTRTGYLFAGWTGSNGSTPSKSVSISKGSTGNKSYTANWTPKKLTTTFYRNQNSSDTITAQQVFTYGVSQSFSAKGWSKTGYTQLGWADSRTATTQQYSTLSGVSDGWVESKYPSNNIYAVWKPNTYSIAYNANGGTGTTATSTHTYDTAKALTSNGFSRTGYTFTGWNTQANGSGTAYSNAQSVKNLTTSNGSTVTLYAQWSVNNYTLTFNANGGSVSPASKSLAYGSQYGTLPTPTRNGYTFTGWFTAASGGTKVSNTTTMGAGNVTLYAQWSPITYTVSYNSNGGSGSMSSSSHTYGVAKNITSNSFSRTGYTFLGWSTNKSATSPTYTNGQSVKDLTFTNGATITLYAVWKANTYKIVFNSNGATSGSMSNMSMTYGVSKNLTSNGFTKTGYEFQGWSTSSTGSVKYTNGQSVNNLVSTNGGSITLYAVWKQSTITAKFNANGGTVSETSRILNPGSTYGTLPTPTRNGYTFKGWYTDPSSGTKVTSATVVGTSDITLYAQWTAKYYTLTMNGNGGAVSTDSLDVSSMTSSDGCLSYTNGRLVAGYELYSGCSYYDFIDFNFDSTLLDGAYTITLTKLNEYVDLSFSDVFINYNYPSDFSKTTSGSTTIITFTHSSAEYGSSSAISLNMGMSMSNDTVAGGILFYVSVKGPIGTSSKPVSCGSTYGNLPTPTRTGYKFKGWFTAPSGGTQVTSSTIMGAASTTIYAQWTATSTLSLADDSNSGTNLEDHRNALDGSIDILDESITQHIVDEVEDSTVESSEVLIVEEESIISGNESVTIEDESITSEDESITIEGVIIPSEDESIISEDSSHIDLESTLEDNPIRESDLNLTESQ